MNEKKKPIFHYIFRGVILGAILGPIIFMTPIIGPLLSLPLLPLIEVYDSVILGEFISSGQHVEIGFMWISLKTVESFLFYASFFAYIGAVIGLLVGLIKPLPRNAILGILTTIILLCLGYLYTIIG